MSATENPAANQAKTDSSVQSQSKVQGEGDYESARKYQKDTERFLKNADVSDLAHKAAPHSKEEAAEMKKAEEIGRSHKVGEKASAKP